MYSVTVSNKFSLLDDPTGVEEVKAEAPKADVKTTAPAKSKATEEQKPLGVFMLLNLTFLHCLSLLEKARSDKTNKRGGGTGSREARGGARGGRPKAHEGYDRRSGTGIFLLASLLTFIRITLFSFQIILIHPYHVFLVLICLFPISHPLLSF